MIKIIPTGYTYEFEVEVYAWSNEKQTNLLIGHHRVSASVLTGGLSIKDLLDKPKPTEGHP
jgi:hypothetical protein